MAECVVFLANGFEEVEAITVIDYLRRADVNVYTVSVYSDNTIEKKVTGSHKVSVFADLNFQEFKSKFSSYLPDLVYTPGGMPGASNLAACKDVTDFIQKCFEAKKYIAAICASPAVVLAKTGVLSGKNWTCYPGMEATLEEHFSGYEAMQKAMIGSTHIRNVPFVTDGNVITGRGAGTAEQFAMELTAILCGSSCAEKIKKSTIQRD